MRQAQHRPYRRLSSRRLPVVFVLSALLASTPLVSFWLAPIGIIGMIFVMFTLDEWLKPTRQAWEQAAKLN